MSQRDWESYFEISFCFVTSKSLPFSLAFLPLHDSFVSAGRQSLLCLLGHDHGQPWPWNPDSAAQTRYSSACWPQDEAQTCGNSMSCWSTWLFPAHCGCCTGEHDGVGVSHHLKTVSGSGRKFSEVKQERNGSEKNLPIPPWGLKEKEKDVSALTVLQLPVPKKKKIR